MKRVLMLVAITNILAFCACCTHQKPELIQHLETLPGDQARIEFLKIPPEEQIEIVSWELENRRPASSKYDYILAANGEGISKPLLEKAASTQDLNVNITMLISYRDIGVYKVEHTQLVHQALEKCFSLGGQKNDECKYLESSLGK